MPGRPTGIVNVGDCGVSLALVSQSGAGSPGRERTVPSHANNPCGLPNKTPPTCPAVLPKNWGLHTTALAQNCGPMGSQIVSLLLPMRVTAREYALGYSWDAVFERVYAGYETALRVEAQ